MGISNQARLRLAVMGRIALLALLPAAPAMGLAAERQILSLDGEWSIADSVGAEEIPGAFPRRVAVPGLINQAQPPFPDVDRFDSREWIDREVRHKAMPESARVTTVGVPRQSRNYFWYQRTFRAPAKRETALLEMRKVQFGAKVWLNGVPVGDHVYCFAAAWLPLDGAIRWGGENTLLIRVGAHPAAMPADVPAGTDFEKLKWTPGLYDSVAVHFTGGPLIESVQVAPRIANSSFLVQTVVRNLGAAGNYTLTHRVKEWKSQRSVGAPASQTIRLNAGETKTVMATVPVPGARLWSPEDPFLYLVESATSGDSVRTRTGMREFRFDTATRRALLNGKVYFLRGSNITLHRFFEDPEAGNLPWHEAWVRKLLAEIPKKLHWNAFRFCIGPAPKLWFDIADEAGLLIQNEFFIWTGGETWSTWHEDWSIPKLIDQYTLWMRDHWNHPSMALWDASNETAARALVDEVIPAVRGLDLSHRVWENGYNLPTGPDDPVEDHPYLFSRNFSQKKEVFRMADLEMMTGGKTTNSAHPSAHATLINEYGWLWLNRDGTPTRLTEEVYEQLLGKDARPADRLEWNAYYLGGLTEFWRAHRNFAGVLHFVYLTCSYPGVYTSDHFRDVKKLELHPAFEKYVGESFKPLGVYVNFWQPTVKPSAQRAIVVMMVNDTNENAAGLLRLDVAGTGSGQALERRYEIPPLGQQSYRFEATFPSTPGDFLLTATAVPATRSPAVAGPTRSVRKYRVEAPR